LKDDLTIREFARALTDLTEKVATPIVWHDRRATWPKRVYGGTCFFLRFACGVLGVTANHVVEALRMTVADHPNMVCQIRTSKPIDLEDLIVDRCDRLDIATFRVPDQLVEAIGVTALDCRGEWPPPEPVAGRVVTFCGFPEAERTTPEPGVQADFLCGGLAIIDGVTKRDVIVTYDPNRDVPAPWAPWKRPLGYNMSGCSGGPVLSHGTRNGLQRWYPVAMIIGGPNGQGSGGLSGCDVITLRRIDVIQSDGAIRREQTGWLPR
jgi:hypothetical protein